MTVTATPYKQNRLQQLRGFCHAARTNSISKAAHIMYLSQPSVSLQIKALEQELEVQLFDRRGPRISLTYDGLQLLKLAGPLVDRMDGLKEAFASQRESPDRGTVNIAAGGSTLQYIMPPFVETFMQEHPLVDVRLHNVTGKGGLELLRKGGVDFAVGPMLDAPPDISFQPVVTHEPMLITARNHPLAKRRRIGLKDVCRYPLIMPPKNQSTYRFVEAVFTDHSLDYDVKLEVGGYDVIKQYVRMGLGVSIVMNHCLSKGDGLYKRPVGRYFPKRAYGIVLHKGKQLSPASERFVDTILAAKEKKKTARRRPRKR
ncbi:MAG: LysR family transcriptional regulator [Planctomycetes bacterium]|nr:LysR family transcriptional regulator [Planctomycetota bacterium]